MSPTTTRKAPAVNPWLIAAAVMLATFMEVLDTSIAAVALPYIAGSLSATNDEATWVLTSYLVELSASLTPGRESVHGALEGTQQYLSAQGASTTTALERAYGLINQSLNAQSRLWSYVDDFRYMALVCFLCVPIVFALKKSVGLGRPGAAH